MSSTIDAGLINSLNAGLNAQEAQKKDGELGQQDFFQLMIAQIRNQDPTQPMDSEQYLAQLAQFSTVNGIQQLQSSFDRLAGTLQSLNALQASSMVGRDVMIGSDRAYLEQGGPVEGSVELPGYTDNMVLSVLDGAGAEVARVPLGNHGAGVLDFSWDGTGHGGAALGDGLYQLRVEGRAGGEVRQFDTQVRASVRSVAIGRSSEDMVLSLAGLGDVSINDIKSIVS